MADVTLVVKARNEAQAALGSVKGDLEQVQKSARSASEQLKAAGTSLMGIGGGLTAGVTLPLAGIGAAALSMQSEFQAATNALIIGTGASGAALDEMQQSVRNLSTGSAGLGVSMEQIGATMAELNTRTGLTGPALEALTGQIMDFSRLAGTDSVNATRLLTRAMGDWGVATEDAAGLLDTMFGAGQAFGISLDSLAGKLVQFGAPLRQMGFSLEESAAMLGKWEKEGVNTELVIGSLRIAAGKFADANIPLRDGLNETMEKIKGAKTESEALSIAMETFGARAGPDMAAAIREGRFELDEAISTLQSTQGGLASATASTIDFRQRWAMSMAQVQNAILPIGIVLADMAERAMPTVIGAIETFTGALQGIDSTVLAGMVGVGAAAAAAGPVMVALGMAMSVAGPAISAVGAALGMLLSPIGLVVGAVVLLGAAWVTNFGGIQEKTAAVWGAVEPTLKAIGDAIANVVNYLVATAETGDDRSAFGYIRKLPEMLQGPTLAIGEFVANASNSWTRLTEAFSTGQTSIGDVLGELVALFTGFGADIYDTTDGIFEFVEALTGSSETASQVTDAIWAASESFAGFKESAVTAFEELSTSVETVMAQIGEILAPAFERVQEAFGGVGESVGELAPHFEGLLTAVQGMGEGLLTAVQGMGETLMPIVQALATALGVTLVVAASVGVNLISSALNRLPGIVGPIIDQVALTINTLSATMTAVAGAIAAIAAGDWAAAWESLKGIVTAFEEFVSGTWTNVTTTLGNIGAAIGEAVVNTLNDLGLSEAAATVQSMIDTLTVFGETLSSILAGETTFSITLPDWLAALLDWAWPSFPDIPTVINALMGFRWPSFPELPSILNALVAWSWPTFPAMPEWISRLLSWSWPSPPDVLGGAQAAAGNAGNWIQQQLGFGGDQLGTSYAHGGWTWVGEAGPELVRLPRGAEVVPNRQSEQMAAGGVSVTVQQMNVRSDLDIYEIAYRVRDLIERG